MNSGCIDPNGQILLKNYFPAPNIPLSEIGQTGGFNYIVNSNAQQNSWQNVIRVRLGDQRQHEGIWFVEPPTGSGRDALRIVERRMRLVRTVAELSGRK